MGMLQRFESRLEQAVSGVFAKAFRSAVQPVELAAGLQRELDNSAQILSRERRLVPNSFLIELSALDHDRLSPYSQTMRRELAEMLQEYADQQRYVFAGPIVIDLVAEDDLSTGRFRIRSRAAAQVQPAPAYPPPAPPPVPRSAAAVEVNGSRYPLTAPVVVVGRGTEADLRVSDPGVSRRHAELHLDGAAGLSVVDLGSTNGTLVNGRRVDRARVQQGDTIRIGHTDLVVRLDQER